MSTHFTLDFSIARLATETLGLYPQPEFRIHQTAEAARQSISSLILYGTARGEHFAYICNLFVSAQVLCSCRTFGVHCGSAACKSRAMAAVTHPVM